jgi:hypothetical protein
LNGNPDRKKAESAMTGTELDGKTFRFKEHVKFFDFEECSFIVDTLRSSLFNLGASSAFIASKIDGRNTVERIIDEVRKRYGASPADSRKVVAGFVGNLEQSGLLAET